MKRFLPATFGLHSRAEQSNNAKEGTVRRWALLILLALAGSLASREAAAGGPVWGKDLVRGSDFPPPFGVSAVYYNQKQDYEIDHLTLGIPGFSAVPTGLLRIDNEIDEVNAKFDAWLLPWLDVFGIAGKLDGKTKVDFSAIQAPFGLPFSRIDIDYDGEVYGLGAVFAGGGEHLFGSLTTIATSTSLSGDFDSSAQAFVATPRFGAYNRRGALYVGAMYLKATEEHKGTIGLPLVPGLPPIPVPFDVKLKQKDDWNWLVGGTAGFGPNWTLQVECGFGNRDHLDVEVGYRF